MTEQENKQVDVAQLKMAVNEKATQLKAVFLAKKVKKTDWTAEFFQDAAKLFGDFSVEAPKFCDKYNLDTKYIKRAEKQGEKAIAQILEE